MRAPVCLEGNLEAMSLDLEVSSSVDSFNSSQYSQPVEPPDGSVCAVCRQNLRDPRLLACLHSFCCSCIDMLFEMAANSFTKKGKVRCPICKTPFFLGEDGAAGLPRNTLCCKATGAAGGVCGDCAETKDALPSSWLCSTCNASLCDAHLAKHLRSRGPHSIERCRLDDADGKSPPVEAGAAGVCRTYDICAPHDEQMKFFCEMCEKPVCGTCTAVGQHRLHQPISLVTEIASKRLESAMGYVEHVRQASWRAEQSISALEASKLSLANRSSRTRDLLALATQRAIDKVISCQSELLRRVDEGEADRLKILENQLKAIRHYQVSLQGAVRFSELLASEGGADLEIGVVVALEKRAAELCQRETFVPAEQKSQSDVIGCFEMPCEKELSEKSLHSLGELHLPGKASARHCSLFPPTGPRVCEKSLVVHYMSVGRESHWRVDTRNDKGEDINTGGDLITVQWAPHSSQTHSHKTPAPHPPTAQIHDHGDGCYDIYILPQESSVFLMKVQVNGQALLPSTHVECHCFPSKVKFRRDVFPEFDVTFDESNRKAVVGKPVGNKRSLLLCGDCSFNRGQQTWVCSSTTRLFYLGVRSEVNQYCIQESTAHCFGWGRSGFGESSRLVCSRTAGSGINRIKSLMKCWEPHDAIRLDLDCETNTFGITNMRSGETDMMADLPKLKLFPEFALDVANDGCELMLL